LYLKEKDDTPRSCTNSSDRKQITKNLIGIALPVAFSAYIRSGLISIEHILIPLSLQKSGTNKSTALAEYGIIQSMVFPLVLYPAAVLYSFSSLLISEVSESNAANNKKRINRIISKVISTSLLYSIGVAGIMACFANELGSVIYPGYDTGKYIRMIAPLIPVMYIDSSVDAILKGMGKQVYSMAINILDVSLSIILVLILLPKYGIEGYILTVYFTELVNTVLSITKLLSISSVRPSITSSVIKPLIAVVGATLCVTLINLPKFITVKSNIIGLLIYISLTATLYFLILFLIGGIKRNHLLELKDIFNDIFVSSKK
jgi:stage V sporulation protein B